VSGIIHAGNGMVGRGAQVVNDANRRRTRSLPK